MARPGHRQDLEHSRLVHRRSACYQRGGVHRGLAAVVGDQRQRTLSARFLNGQPTTVATMTHYEKAAPRPSHVAYTVDKARQITGLNLLYSPHAHRTAALGPLRT